MSITELASPEKKDIRDFFDSIASRYDFINSFLSFNLDDQWRKKALKILIPNSQGPLLDIGTGTGRFLEMFLQSKNWEHAYGLDFSGSMLDKAKQGLPKTVFLIQADLHDLPFDEESFGLIISSFTLRSVKKMDIFLREVFRILKPGGRASFLCLTRPGSSFYRMMYYPYLKYYLPLAGKLISGHGRAYRFLAESIQHFQDPEVTMKAMANQNFRNIRKYGFTMGAATLITGEK